MRLNAPYRSAPFRAQTVLPDSRPGRIAVIPRLTLPSLGPFLHFLVVEATEVHDLAQWWICLAVYFHEVEACLPGHTSCLIGSEDAEHGSIMPDHSYLWNADEIVDAGRNAQEYTRSK
jgi:hypothetical protein